jgi:cytochrome c-type biogenesis protein CcmH/NrfG
MVYTAALGVDPAGRGQTYSAKANGAFQTAIKLNPENPRPYYMQGTTVLYTPEEFGGGKKAAQPLFEQAMKLFEKSNTESGLMPSWGKEDCERYLEDCKKES